MRRVLTILLASCAVATGGGWSLPDKPTYATVFLVGLASFVLGALFMFRATKPRNR